MRRKTKIGILVFALSITVFFVGLYVFANADIAFTSSSFAQDYLVFVTGLSFLVAVFSLPIFFMEDVRGNNVREN